MIALSTEQELALAFCGRRFREPLSLLLQFDRSLGRAIQQQSAPIAGQIRLAWWRDEVAALEMAPRSNPVLAAFASFIGDQALGKEALAQIVDAWEILLGDGDLSDEGLMDYARARGGSMFRLAADVSQAGARMGLEEAGTLWALVDFARHCADPVLAKRAFELGPAFLGSARQLPGHLRSFAILAYFAERDVIRGFDKMVPAGSPRRIVQAWKFSLGFG